MASLKMRYFSCTFDYVGSEHLEGRCLFSLFSPLFSSGPGTAQRGFPSVAALFYSLESNDLQLAVFIFAATLAANYVGGGLTADM